MGEVIQFDGLSSDKTERAIQIAKDAIHGLVMANMRFAEIDEWKAKLILFNIQGIFTLVNKIEEEK